MSKLITKARIATRSSVVFLTLALILVSVTPVLAQDGISVSADGSSATAVDAPFAISDFTRFNTGTSKTYQGIDYGYRFPMVDADSFAVVVTADTAVIFVPPAVAESSWFRPSLQSETRLIDGGEMTALISMLSALDAAVSNGGVELSAAKRQFILTDETGYQLMGVRSRGLSKLSLALLHHCQTGRYNKG